MNQGLTLRTIYQPYVNRMNTKLQRTDVTMKDNWLMKNMFDEKGNLRPIWDFDRAAIASRFCIYRRGYRKVYKYGFTYLAGLWIAG